MGSMAPLFGETLHRKTSEPHLPNARVQGVCAAFEDLDVMEIGSPRSLNPAL